MKFIIGRKKNMTQVFAEDGTVTPVTVIEAGPCFITQVKDAEKDGYPAVQLGYQKAKKLNKALKGHLKDSFDAKKLQEFRLNEDEIKDLKKGQELNVSIFDKDEKVKVTGNVKGRGFQGVVKRHGFKGQKATHGNKDQLRMPGSIGATGPAHVFKGIRMAGRMGGNQVTVSNLRIVDINPEKNLLYIKGAIPGSPNGLVSIVSPGELDLSRIKKEDLKTEEKKEQVKQAEENQEKTEKTEEQPQQQKTKEEKSEQKKEEPSKEQAKKEEKEESAKGRQEKDNK